LRQALAGIGIAHAAGHLCAGGRASEVCDQVQIDEVIMLFAMFMPPGPDRISVADP